MENGVIILILFCAALLIVVTAILGYRIGYKKGCYGITSNTFPFKGEVWKLVDILIDSKKRNYHVFRKYLNYEKYGDEIVISGFKQKDCNELSIDEHYRISQESSLERSAGSTFFGPALMMVEQGIVIQPAR